MQVFYEIRFGDTLYNIAKRFNLPLNSLYAANNLDNPNSIFPGQQLSMPPGVTTYVVKRSDTLFTIANSFGIDSKLITDANNINPPYILMIGDVLNIPQGVPYYTVRPGDSLYKIVLKYNVVVDGMPRPDLIIRANAGVGAGVDFGARVGTGIDTNGGIQVDTFDVTDTDIDADADARVGVSFGSTTDSPVLIPGMKLVIPYPPPGGYGQLATLFSNGLSDFVGIYDPTLVNMASIGIGQTSVNNNRNGNIFWSPNNHYLAILDGNGILSILNVKTKKIVKIDQSIPPNFVDWSYDSRKIIYSNGKVIRIYDLPSSTFKTIDRPGASYVQWFPNGTKILFEAKTKAGISQLFTSNADGSNKKQLTNNTSGPMNWVRLSPNANSVLYTSPGASISEIYTMELASGRLSKLPSGPEAKNYYPAWSPDSAWIAYCSTQFIGGKYYSWIRYSKPTGEVSTTIAISSCYSTPVTWSPDSAKIAYLSSCSEDSPAVEVWSIAIQKPYPINLLSGSSFYSIDWSITR